ncbi:MAG: cyclase family protein [Desulfovibrio sp.]|jgi:kynurenine formamidase|nr:cyclase family protein [Desulfovibrio sp.]
MKPGKIIDLSQEIYNGMPLYPGHLKTIIFTHLSHEECRKQLGTGFSYTTQGLIMCGHGPTHVDSWSHFTTDPGAEHIDKLALEKCITTAICVDVSDTPLRAQWDARKIRNQLVEWKLDIRQGDTVLFYTGMYDRYYGKDEYMSEFPGMTRDATEFIIDSGCVNFGVDNPSPDMWYDKTYPCHSVCGERGVTHVENLCNLDKLVGKRFTYIGLPLKIRDGTGSPIRAVAILDE